MPHDRTLLVMVPGAGIAAGDFESNGLVRDMRQRYPGIAHAAVDPGLDSYLDGSVERRLLGAIDEARCEAGATRVWLAGISLGCQGILRCVRQRPGLAEGVILLTPYITSTGVIAEIVRSGSLRSWTPSGAGPDRDLLAWLAATPSGALPRVILGHALQDRFAATATVLAGLPPTDMVSVPGGHDWASWRALWRLVLDRDPFA